MKQRGKLYGVGVGPGDPELMTVKAIRTIERSDVIVVPGKKAEDSVAYQIAAGICNNLADIWFCHLVEAVKIHCF